jgi:tRNA-dihydrouridine synthase B
MTAASLPPLPLIGPYVLPSRVVLAPMAGVTDRPFRVLCRQLGAGLAPSEMLTSDTRLWTTAKSRHRLSHEGEPEPRVVQLAGSDPEVLASAARQAVAQGAQIIDVNMGCPAKKVCGRLCGSALMREPALVAQLLAAVVAAVDVPVTLKMRTGWDVQHRNGPLIARIAEEAGCASLAVHGRTRADFYEGSAEYETIREIKSKARIPVFANGDITSPAKALEVLQLTGADGVMLGRASQGAPWIFREVSAHLAGRAVPPAPQPEELRDIILGHLDSLYAFYGEETGVRIGRKHLGWYCGRCFPGSPVRQHLMAAVSTAAQFALIEQHFNDQVASAALS